jgi:hypothetical protein
MRQVAGRPSGKKNSSPEEAVGGVPLQFAIDLEVSEDERVRVPAARKRDPDALADAAVRAVAADEIARPHALGVPVPVPKRAADVLLTGCERDQFDAAFDLDAVFG